MNELVKYESSFGLVELTPKTVKDYLVKGNGDVSDQEVTLFIEMCKAQKLNPFVTGEAYLIKFGQQPAQMVIGLPLPLGVFAWRMVQSPQNEGTARGHYLQGGGLQ